MNFVWLEILSFTVSVSRKLKFQAWHLKPSLPTQPEIALSVYCSTILEQRRRDIAIASRRFHPIVCRLTFYIALSGQRRHLSVHVCEQGATVSADIASMTCLSGRTRRCPVPWLGQSRRVFADAVGPGVGLVGHGFIPSAVAAFNSRITASASAPARAISCASGRLRSGSLGFSARARISRKPVTSDRICSAKGRRCA